MSSRIALCWDSSLVFSPVGVLDGVVLVLVSEDDVVVVAVVFSEALGVTAVSGIFGGLVVPSPSPALSLAVDPSAPGVVDVTPPAGVVAVGALAWATVVVTTWALAAPLLNAATAAAAAPSTSTAAAPRTTTLERQLGVPRLPGAPAPHCRHQS